MKLRYTTRAKLDIAEIHDYIAQENHRQQDASSCSSEVQQKRYCKILKSAGLVESPEPAN